MYAWESFLIVAQGGRATRPPVVLVANNAFLARLVGMSAVDLLLYPMQWLRARIWLTERFPDAVLLPGYWVEYGTAVEASAFGASIMWRHDHSPVTRPLRLPIDQWGNLPHPDPHTDGLMALVLRRLWNLEKEGELPAPYQVNFVVAQGPFAVAAHVLGVSNFMSAIEAEPEYTRQVLDVLEITTEAVIRYLQAQLGCLREPLGIVLHDDTVGLLPANTFNRFAVPYLKRIFDQFEGLVRIFRNDAPMRHLLPLLSQLDFEVFHLSHKVDIADASALAGQVALMGNVPPLDILGHGTPEQVDAATRDCLARARQDGRHILSSGGALLPGTPAENVDAMIRVALE